MFLKIILGLLSCAQFGLAIRCFDCTSVNNSMCLDPSLYDSETLKKFMHVTDCSEGVMAPTGEFFCRKIHQTILRKHYEPEVRVLRGCGWRRNHRDCYNANNEDHLETVCQCFNDMCNASPTISVTRYFSLSVALLGICLSVLL